MKNIFKVGLATAVATQAQFASAAIDFEGAGGATVKDGLKGSGDDAANAIQVIITSVISFLYLVAVIYALWGGFNILTAGGDEEKVKKGKTILIQALIGMVVIFLASSIVQWLVGTVLVSR